MATALIYDGEMTRHRILWDDPICGIEVPERLTVTYDALVQSGLADRCVSIPVREATEEEILLIHSEEYLQEVKKTEHMSVHELKEASLKHDAVFFHPDTYYCAKLAAGAALQLVDHVMVGKVKNGMALVRPPGHHSMRDAACGFCTFNNVAIAAQYAKQTYGLKRVLIVDWDVHHGQGVQYCFEDDPSVLYFSWHRYEHSTFWPNLSESDYDAVGKEKGVGFTINVPWNKVGMKNSDFLSVFCHVLLPVAYEFCPELVLVSAGFDSGIGDPEGEMCATPDVFAHLTHLLMNLAGGKVCAVLEGGYNLTSLSQSVCQTVQTLLGDPNPLPENLGSPCQSALDSVQCARWAHRKHWSCLRHAADLSSVQINTKRQITDGEKENGKKQKEECVWPEPAKRVAPPIRTAVLLSDDTVCPDGCHRLASSDESGPRVGKLRENVLNGDGDHEALSALNDLVTFTEKLESNEICNGLAVVRDVNTAMTCVVQHVTTAPNNRVLVVCVGDGKVPNGITGDGKALVVQIGSRETEQSKHYISVHLKKGCSDLSGFIQAVFGLLLPLGFELNPSLVLLVRMSGSDVSDGMWQQLTGLLQSIAKGHILVLMQECEKACVSPTASSLLGNPAPPLGQLQAPHPQDVEEMEKLRLKLLVDWKLLQTTAPDTGDEL